MHELVSNVQHAGSRMTRAQRSRMAGRGGRWGLEESDGQKERDGER